MIISLTGFMGCGKSSVGRELSELLCCRFMDLDEVICEKAGKSIPEIFASEGEAAFRRMETETLREIVEVYGGNGVSRAGGDGRRGSDRQVGLVLALGGGTVMTPECAYLVHEHTFCVYLQASVETLLAHLGTEADGRPMLQSPADLRTRIIELMEVRSSTYERVSHLILDTDGKNVSEIAMLCKAMCK